MGGGTGGVSAGACVCVCVCGCLSPPMDGCVTQGSPAGVFMQQHGAFVLFEKGVRLLMTQRQRVSDLL